MNRSHLLFNLKQIPDIVLSLLFRTFVVAVFKYVTWQAPSSKREPRKLQKNTKVGGGW